MRGLLPRIAHRVAEGLDRAFLRASFRSTGAGRRAARASILERLDRAAVFYAEAARDGRLFPTPERPRWEERSVRRLPDHGTVVDLRFPSHYVALEATHADTLQRCPENAVCHARWYRHRSPAPTIVCLHGWGCGQFAIEERAYPAAWLYAHGLDVVLATLPFHARRKPSRRVTPMFPSTSPIRTVEGFAQAVLDVRSLIAGLRADGAPVVGVSGLSLGGNTSALLATVDPTLGFVVPMIAFTCVAELMWEHGAGTDARRRAEEAGITRERFAAAFAACRPVARAPVVPPERVLVIAGERDLVCGRHHAERLRDHFGAALHTFPGAHLLQIGRAAAFGALVAFLTERGVLR